MFRRIPAGAEWSEIGAVGAMPSSICVTSSDTDGTLLGSGAISVPMVVSTAVSSTPGRVG